MKRWKVWHGFRDENGYREEAIYVSGSTISAAAKNATKELEARKNSGLIADYMITDIGLLGDPKQEVC